MKKQVSTDERVTIFRFEKSAPLGEIRDSWLCQRKALEDWKNDMQPEDF